MSGSSGAYVPVQVLSLGLATEPIGLTDVLIVTQNGVPRECTVASFLDSPSVTVMLTAGQWTAGTVTAVGAGSAISGGTLYTQWEAGTVTALGSGISLASGTLTVTGAAQQWTAGTVTAVATGLAVNAGTLVPQWEGGTVTALGSGVSLAAGTLSATGTATVTSVQVSGGSTGLTTSGGPVTTSGTITLGGTLATAAGGTGWSALATSITSAATITPTITTPQYEVTALAASATIAAPSGSPQDGQQLVLRFKDNGTARGLTWTTSAGGYRPVGLTLPTTTTVGSPLYIGCLWNSQDGFWDAIASTQ